MTTVAVTWYALHSMVLFCDVIVTADTEPWVAMPAAWYENGGECGDRVGIKADGEIRYFVALDRIAPGDWYVVQPEGTYKRLGADVPDRFAWFPSLSTTGRVWRVEDLRERWKAYR